MQEITKLPHHFFRTGNKCFVIQHKEMIGRRPVLQTESSFLILFPIFSQCINMFLSDNSLFKRKSDITTVPV